MELEDEEEKKRAGASKIERRNLMMTLMKRTRGKRENEETERSVCLCIQCRHSK